MSSSPAWLTIALTSLASVDSPTPSAALASGIRPLPTPHILHHLNRWARHVWRPAAPAQALAALKSDVDHPRVDALGPGAAALLAALVEAVRRCEAGRWLDVLGVMFLADDPWVVEVGRMGDGKDADRAARAMRMLYEGEGEQLREAARELGNGLHLIDGTGEGGAGEESLVELRCRVAALQLQMDDVTAVVRRNEKNTKDLLSSFHFWSMLLLDELRSYKQKAMTQKSSTGGSDARGNQKGTEAAGMYQSFAKEMAAAVEGLEGASGSEQSSVNSGVTGQEGQGEKPRGQKAEGHRLKRVFRDGKWVAL